MSDREVTISTLSILKVLFILLLVWFLFAIREIVLVFIISIIIASAIDPLADFLYKKKVPRGLSVILVYALFFGFIILIVSLLVRAITQEFKLIAESDFQDELSSKIGIYKDQLSGFSEGLQNSFKEIAGGISGTIFQTTKSVLTAGISVITVLAVSFYLTVEESGMKNVIKHLTPYKHQAYAMKLVGKIQKKIGHWVLGQFILSLVIFGLTFLGLSLLKVEFALVLALIAGALEIIPYIGPFIAAIPAVFFAFLQNPALAVAVIVLYIIIQQLENHVIVPIVMSKSVGLNPVIVILGILIGGTLGGIVGAVIAVPVISGISVFITDLYDMNEEMQT